MKPQPPMSLLGPGQVWTVVDAADWQVVRLPRGCGVCGDAATAWTVGGKSNTVRYRCEAHLDRYVWTSGDRVVRWRANPYFNNDTAHKPLAAWIRGRV